MTEAKLEFPEVTGKLVAELSVYEDAEFGKEVLVRFRMAHNFRLPLAFAK